MAKISPLAPKGFPEIPPIAGVSLASGSCGLRYQGRRDVLLAALDKGTQVAGVFTTSKTAAAPVHWCAKAAKAGRARALIVNAGNANAFTGLAGEKSVQRTVAKVASVLDCPKSQVFVASTGVIGETLPDDRIRNALAGLKKALRPDDWPGAASAIMTTDTFAKGAQTGRSIRSPSTATHRPAIPPCCLRPGRRNMPKFPRPATPNCGPSVRRSRRS